MTHHVYLIPGFFGFVNFGRLIYFGHVRSFLEDAFGRRDVEIEIHRVRIAPTASLRTRAGQLAAQIAETSPRGPIHLIGHSTGGLDARLFVTPGVSLDGDPAVEALARRVQTVVSVAAPHHGTPLASFFTTILGQKLLSVLSIATVTLLREGRLPLSLVARLGSTLSRVLIPGGTTEAVLAHLEDELVGRLPADDRDHLGRFFDEIKRDRSLMPQLMPEGIDLFNAACSPRPGVRYASVVVRARPPRWTGHLKAGWPDAQVSYLLYRWLFERTAAGTGRAPTLDGAQRAALATGFGELPGPGDSDGVVPTLSQVHGEVIATAQGDHLDVIGHFRGEQLDPPHHDWLTSGSHFDRAAFEQLWYRVAGYLVPSVPRRGFWSRG